MLPVVPRTKKTSNRIVSFGKPCWTCKRKPHQKVLPSEAFEQFERDCSLVWPEIRQVLEARGVGLPITSRVSVRALFYRDADRGDSHGYYQALADVLQGLGVIADDRLIEDWDGSRRLKDAARPRVEVTITVLETSLFEGVAK